MCACDSNWTNLSVALGQYIYAVGGWNAGTMGPTERYDPAANTWTRLGDLGFFFKMGAVAVLNGQMWACGGKDRNGLCQILDTTNNTWIAAATMNEPRSVVLSSKSRSLHDSISCSAFRRSFCMATLNDKLYAISGYRRTTIEFFDASNPSAGWQLYSQASFAVERAGSSCVAIQTSKTVALSNICWFETTCYVHIHALSNIDGFR